MKEYTILKINDCIEGSAVPEAEIDTVLWLPDAGIRAAAQVTYNGNALYVLLKAKEKAVRAEHTGRYGMPCEDSCLEFFFRPLPEDSRYLNLEFNPNTSFYAGIGHCGKDLIRLLPDPALFRASSARTRDGWEISYRIPYSFIRMFFPSFSPHRGDIMYGNFFKCGDLTEKEHYLSWNPVTSERPDFHRPQDFGLLRFG
ncbi:MAG: hypothetical protein IJJ50_02870 [Lachnospiraceae bacterium]|nr:hypothetical protein [Lachnospiraceae bacterium]